MIALPNAPRTTSPSASLNRDSDGSKSTDSTEEERAGECCDRGANRLTGCGERRHRTRECDEKRARGDSGPHSIAIRQERGKRDSVGRPHRPEIAAPDVGGGLTEFAGNEIREKHGRDLHDEFARGRQPASDGVAGQEP